MATNKRADADRLPISQRIDQRMPNPKRREAVPTNWQIKGELFSQLLVRDVLPLCRESGRAPSHGRALPRMDGDRDRRRPL